MSESIDEILARISGPEETRDEPETEDAPVVHETVAHPDAKRLRAEIGTFSTYLMGSLKRALESGSGKDALQKLRIHEAEGGVKDTAGVDLSLWLTEGGAGTGGRVFLTGIDASGGVFVIEQPTENEDENEDESSTTINAQPLDINTLGVNSLYEVESGVIRRTLRLNPDTAKIGAFKPTPATLIEDGGEYYGQTESGRRYRVPMVDVRNYKPRAKNKIDPGVVNHAFVPGDKVAILVPTADPSSPWANAVPLSHYTPGQLGNTP